jgi:hypothetical protein
MGDGFDHFGPLVAAREMEVGVEIPSLAAVAVVHFSEAEYFLAVAVVDFLWVVGSSAVAVVGFLWAVGSSAVGVAVLPVGADSWEVEAEVHS